jgi:hypothetical protein
MSMTCTFPSHARASGCTKPFFMAALVAVCSARTLAPNDRPVSLSRPEGMPTAKARVLLSLIAPTIRSIGGRNAPVKPLRQASNEQRIERRPKRSGVVSLCPGAFSFCFAFASAFLHRTQRWRRLLGANDHCVVSLCLASLFAGLRPSCATRRTTHPAPAWSAGGGHPATESRPSDRSGEPSG